MTEITMNFVDPAAGRRVADMLHTDVLRMHRQSLQDLAREFSTTIETLQNGQVSPRAMQCVVDAFANELNQSLALLSHRNCDAVVRLMLDAMQRISVGMAESLAAEIGEREARNSN